MLNKNFKTFVKINIASPDVIDKWAQRLILLRTKKNKKQKLIIGDILTDKIISNEETLRVERRNSILIKRMFQYKGLFCETLFGPLRNFNCICINSHRKKKNILFTSCPNCGITLTSNKVRSFRMGTIPLIVPILHTWFFFSNFNILNLLLDIPINLILNLFYYDFSFNTHNKLLGLLKKRLKLSSNIKMLTSSTYEQILIKKILEENVIDNKFVVNLTIPQEVLMKLLTDIDLQKEISYSFNLIYTNLNNDNFDIKKQIKKHRILENFYFSKTNPAWIFLCKIPVIPPAYRPLEESLLISQEGSPYDSESASVLNSLYQNIIRRNNSIFNLLKNKNNCNNIFIFNEIRLLQESVDFLIDNAKLKNIKTLNNKPLKSLSDMIKGKFGRFRKQLLGKRVNFSARSVISTNPSLRLSQCGIPFEIAQDLFKPYILALVNTIFDENYRTFSVNILYKILTRLIKNKTILLNRAPTLHRLGIQAFNPILVSSKSIQVHPLVCSAYNADFDGDQMSIHLPINHLSHFEIKNLFGATKNLNLSSNSDPKLTLSQDMILGLVYLTKKNENIKSYSFGNYFENLDSVLLFLKNKKLRLHSPIWINKKNKIQNKININSFTRTTAGRVLLNSLFIK